MRDGGTRLLFPAREGAFNQFRPGSSTCGRLSTRLSMSKDGANTPMTLLKRISPAEALDAPALDDDMILDLAGDARPAEDGG